MNLSINRNIIVLNEIGILKKYQISQLEFYGFKTENGSLKKVSVDLEPDLIKITDFFRNEDININYSDEVLATISEISRTKDSAKALFAEARAIKEGALFSEPFAEFCTFLDSLPRKLKPHQVKAAYHFYRLKNAANFSVPGSGKTSVVLSVYEKLRTEGICDLLFIIGPPSCFQPWKNEFYDTLGRVPEALILSGGSKLQRRSEYFKSQGDLNELYLCSFQTALNDYADIMRFLSQAGLRTFLVIDEAHYMKSIGGAWANSLLHIGSCAQFKGILTGTPIPKSYKDIFNLFDFLWGRLSPLKEQDKLEIDLWEKKKKDEQVKALLQEKIGPLFYRVRKTDLGLLEPVFHPPIQVKMNTDEDMIYRFVKAKITDLSAGDYLHNEDVLNHLWRGRMIRLRQAVSYPKLLKTAIENYSEKFIDDSELTQKIRNYDDFEVPGKLTALTALVMNLRSKGEKVLIWSNFIGTLELIKTHLLSLGERCELIYGKTPVRKENDSEFRLEKTREDIRDEFVHADSGLDILIANPAACAESISLHKTCFHAIYYDLSYNCAQYIQSLDRIHRVGGSEKMIANYYFLQYENSLDQDIKNNLEKKAQKMYDVIEQDYTIYDLDLYEESDDDISAYKRLFTNKEQ